MTNLFEHASSCWVRYSQYECRKAVDGYEYVVPAKDAKPGVYDPLKDSQNLVVDALNVGMLCMNKASDAAVKSAVMDFVSRYGLLGLMTAIPTTPTFMDYEAVYLLKNQFIRDETIDTEEYLSLFLPFEKLQFTKKDTYWRWDVTDDRMMIALGLTFHNKPAAQIMCFMREYGERYDWLVKQFKDWAFAFCSSYLYYKNHDALDEDTRAIYRQGMACFDGIAPTYHIELREKPTIVWDYHSLLLAVRMMLTFMLTDEQNNMKLCANCQKVFLASRPNALFCSQRCKDQHSAKKGRN
jgi:hypothetical protein